MKNRGKHRLRFALMSLLAGWFLAACAGAATPQVEAGPASQESSNLEAVIQAVPTQSAGLGEAQGGSTPTQATNQDQANEPAAPAQATVLPTSVATPVEVRAELQASDPAGVQLAAGQVQLVEFFAYW